MDPEGRQSEVMIGELIRFSGVKNKQGVISENICALSSRECHNVRYKPRCNIIISTIFHKVKYIT